MNINTFRAFRSRNYRLYFSGQSVSLIGTWMQRTAVYWLVYEKTHSAFMLGLLCLLRNFLPFYFLLLAASCQTDITDIVCLLITQVASLVQAILLTALVLFTHYTVWEILAFSVVLGTINAFDVPARQSMVHEIVDDKEDLPNAIAS